jgi:hypothetical protein
MHALVTRPLDTRDRTRRTPIHGVPATRIAGRLVKPSATLAPLDRIEIYNRMYWFRLLDSFAEDLPGLRALLGDKKFWRLAQAYLTHQPSRSYTLRNLCARLPRFLRAAPAWTRPHTAAAIALARFEWAQIVAFDGATLPRLRPAQLRRSQPGQLRLQLQPYLSLLTLDYAVHDFWQAIKQGGALRATASQAITGRRAFHRTQDPITPEHRRVHLAVHRYEGRIYTKELEPAAAAVLRALARGETVATASTRAFSSQRGGLHPQVVAVQTWFAEWTRLGWLSAR